MVINPFGIRVKTNIFFSSAIEFTFQCFLSSVELLLLAEIGCVGLILG